MKTLSEHLSPDTSQGPKRILSLDGGGVRGAFTLGYLQRLEAILRKRTNNPKLVLSDYFDLIGGTSTGAIIAAGLAMGHDTAYIAEKYKTLSGEIFGKKYRWYNVIELGRYVKAKYNHAQLEEELKSFFGNITLGSSDIKTGLCIVTKRADTNSIWPLINHPGGKYYDTPGMGQNKNILLWKAVRASTAAPTYFTPVVIDVGDGVKGAFVDGGLSTANNPSLTLMMVALLKGFPFRWTLGIDNLELYSFGTGYGVYQKMKTDITESNLLKWAMNAPSMLMDDSNWLNQIMLQWMGDSPNAAHIDGEIGDLSGDRLCEKSLLYYVRCNMAFVPNELEALTGRTFDDKEVEDLLEMSNAKNVDALMELGRKRAASELKESFIR